MLSKKDIREIINAMSCNENDPYSPQIVEDLEKLLESKEKFSMKEVYAVLDKYPLPTSASEIENFPDKLQNKNIKVKELNEGDYFRKEWEKHFAHHLSDEEKESINMFNCGDYRGYLWHLFSYRMKEYLEGEDAEKAFDQEQKNKCYIFYQHSDQALLIENATALSISDLPKYTDVYVVDSAFNWTFVLTHETGLCGPYFSRKEDV